MIRFSKEEVLILHKLLHKPPMNASYLNRADLRQGYNLSQILL